MNIEQKAWYIVATYCTESDDHDYPQHECRKCKQMAEEIAAALQSAVAEEREEWRKLETALEAATIRYSRDHGEPNPTEPFPFEVVFGIQEWGVVQDILAAIRARGQKEIA